MKVVANASSYRVKCPSCLSIIEFQRHETRDCLHVGGLHFRGIECPVCKRTICVTSRQSAGAPDEFRDSIEAVYQEEDKGSSL